MADVTTIRQTLLGILSSQFPDISFQNNIIDRLLVQPATAIYGYISDDVERKLKSVGLQNIVAGLVDEDVARSFLQGLGVSISDGLYATGSATILVSSTSVITIPAGTIFTTTSNLSYESTETVRAIPSEEYRLSPEDRILVRVGPYWGFDVPLKATSVGSVYNIQENTPLSTTLEIPNLYAILSSSFYGGADPETAKEAANRILAGLGIRGLANNTQVLSLLRTASTNKYYDNNLLGTIAVSVIGANDAEMQRDRRGILPVSIGGKIDIYVRTLRTPIYTTKRVTATLIGINSNNDGIWSFTVGRGLCPVSYLVTKVRSITSLPTDEGYEITLQTASLDLNPTGFPFVPDIASIAEGVFSPFHKITVEFVDTDTEVLPEEVGTRTQDYYATIYHMPAVDSAQKYLSCDEIRPVGLDILVKAPFICHVNTRIYLTKTVSDEIANAIKAKASEFINSLMFEECVYGADLADAVNSLLPSGVYITNTTFGGSILLPNLTYYTIGFSSSLCVPTLSAYGVSGKNTALVQYPQNVSILVS